MQIIDDSGNQRAAEPFEVEAIEAARRAHEEEQAREGVFVQWGEEDCRRELLAIVANAVEVPVAKAVHMRGVYPPWEAGASYSEGDRVDHMAALWRCLQAHESQAGWQPDVSPSLWSKVLISDVDGGEPPEWEQPGSTNGYDQGDRVTHGGKVWVSLVANNVWEPGAVGTENVWREVAGE